MNEYDSARMADVLAVSHGLELTDDPVQADALLLITCSIRREGAGKSSPNSASGARFFKQARPAWPSASVVASLAGVARLSSGAPHTWTRSSGPQTLHRLPQLLDTALATHKPAVDISFPEIGKIRPSAGAARRWRARSCPVAVVSLILRCCFGGYTLYALGAFARTHPRLAHYIHHDFTAPFAHWRFEHMTMRLRFFGPLRTRVPVHDLCRGSGFFRHPLSTYIPMAIASGLILVTALFTISILVRQCHFPGVVSHARWGIAGVFLLTLFFIGRRNLRAYCAKRNEL